MRFPSKDNHFLSDHANVLNTSYRKLVGSDLVVNYTNHQSLAEALFYAPFVVVSHNTEADPVFNYANLKALQLFEFDWDEFTALPSRLSAEPAHQSERAKLLADVAKKGFSNGYTGVRVTKSGARFLIQNAVVWNLFDKTGTYAGQAARFDEWQFL